MKLKEKFENHYVVFGLTLIFVGFVSGFGAARFLFNFVATGNGNPNTLNLEKEISILVAEHNKQKNDLLSEYYKSEKEATNLGHISLNQQIYVESANRIKELIKQEDEAFALQLDKLQSKVASK